MISFAEATRITLDRLSPLETETVDPLCAVGRAAATDLAGQVDSPSADVSLKDGYAVRSVDLARASQDAPVRLRLVGTIEAGASWKGRVSAGQAVRILSGAPVPQGADAVLAEEFASVNREEVLAWNDAEPGRNILPRGSDVRADELLVRQGERLSPATVGLLAAAGVQQVPVVRLPRVAILATGDEVVAPGEDLRPGTLYASNLVTLAGWCRRYGFEVHTRVAHDDEEEIRAGLQTGLSDFDAVLTSGGAWSSERDLVVRLLEELGWERAYHRVRIGPGKAIAFGTWKGKAVFCLPGGPPSNHSAFLQLALPGLQRLAGWREACLGLPERAVRLAQTVLGPADWTQFIHGRLEQADELPRFHPLRSVSRLQMMANADAIVTIPEGTSQLEEGAVSWAQVLTLS